MPVASNDTRSSRPSPFISAARLSQPITPLFTCDSARRSPAPVFHATRSFQVVSTSPSPLKSPRRKVEFVARNTLPDASLKDNGRAVELTPSKLNAYNPSSSHVAAPGTNL